MTKYCVVLFYKYCNVPNDVIGETLTSLQSFTEKHNLKGRIILAEEGINGTVAGMERDVKDFVHLLESLEKCHFSEIDWKYSYGEGELPFIDMYIKESKELISTGDARQLIQQSTYFESDSFGGMGGTGVHLKPQQFHEALGSDPNAVVLDIRNEFEYDIGHFEGALNLKTNTYAETWRNLDQITSDLDHQNCGNNDSVEDKVSVKKRNYYMYCTGGIRCEKASAYLKAKGFDNVFQLQGGIHRYLEEYPGNDKKFLGRNFVFDTRMIEKSEDTNIENTFRENSEREVIGRCVDCGDPYDAYCCDQRCSVCRQPVLLCPNCKKKRIDTEFNEVMPHHTAKKEYHCKNHRDIYFKNLEIYTLDALRMQCDALRELEKDKNFIGKEHKNRRKTIRNQIRKIEQEEERRICAGQCDQNGAVNNNDESNITKVVGGLWGS